MYPPPLPGSSFLHYPRLHYARAAAPQAHRDFLRRVSPRFSYQARLPPLRRRRTLNRLPAPRPHCPRHRLHYCCFPPAPLFVGPYRQECVDWV